jgi:xanthine dehydrogenase YagS FAD-binding subunit
MKSFTYERADSPTKAAATAARVKGAKFIAGVRPARLTCR